MASEAVTSASTSGPPVSLSEDNWFFYVGTGIGHSWLDDSIQTRVDQQKAAGGSSPSVANLDLPGIYHRIRPGMAGGLLLNGTFEHVARKWQDKDSLAIHSYNPSLSLLYFPQGTTGIGWFTRGDLGYSRIVLIRESGDQFDYTVDSGVFAQAAAGYAWRATSVARLMMHLSVYRAQGAHQYLSGMFYNVGFLF